MEKLYIVEGRDDRNAERIILSVGGAEPDGSASMLTWRAGIGLIRKTSRLGVGALIGEGAVRMPGSVFRIP